VTAATAVAARHPDHDVLAEAERLATAAIADEPWERWW
jgi:hypothetical protein